MRMLAQLNGLAPDCEIINDAVILFRGGGCLKDLGHEIILHLMVGHIDSVIALY